jgi:hypothetical protein
LGWRHPVVRADWDSNFQVCFTAIDAVFLKTIPETILSTNETRGYRKKFLKGMRKRDH